MIAGNARAPRSDDIVSRVIGDASGDVSAEWLDIKRYAFWVIVFYLFADGHSRNTGKRIFNYSLAVYQFV